MSDSEMTVPPLPAVSPGRRRPRVVIIGGGFGGLAAARALRSAPVDVVLLDRSNHHVFQPLLYQVATATLAPSDIAAPIRWLLRKHRNATVLLAEVKRIDVDRKVVLVSRPGAAMQNSADVAIHGGDAPPPNSAAIPPSSRGTAVTLDETLEEISFDFLVVSAGTRHAYFGHEEWEPLAPGLKTIDDAIEIRRRFLMALERAEWTEDADQRRALQTFVVVGGGPTGVELAGILPEIVGRTMRDDFRRVDPRATRVILLEAGPRLLPTFSEQTSERVAKDLAELGVQVRCGATVTRIAPDAVYVGDEATPTSTVFWAAGNKGTPLAHTLNAPQDRYGRIAVQPDLAVPGHKNIFVVGDLAHIEQDGQPVPGVAQAAIQGGRTAARNIMRTLEGRERIAFRYRDRGNAATIGRHKAIFELAGHRLSGRPAWFFWLFLHILYLAGFRNRLSVLLEWAYAYFSFQRGSRLITRT